MICDTFLLLKFFRSALFAHAAIVAIIFSLQCGKNIRKPDTPVSTLPNGDAEPHEIPSHAEVGSDSTQKKPQGSLKVDPPAVNPKARKKRGRFQFSSDEFIKETGYNPFEKKNDTIMRLKGHARVASKNLKMASPQIEIYGDDGRMAYAKGPVEILDTRDGTRITGDEALFIRGENRAILRGNARLTTKARKKNKTNKITLHAHELERNFETSISIARGKVSATSGNGTFYADEAEFLEREDLLRSSDNPRIFSASDLFLADTIEWNIARTTADFHGNVRAYFSRSEDGKKKQPVDASVKSEEGTLVQRESLPFGQRLTLKKKVNFERQRYSAYSDEAEIFGSGAELVKAYDSVELINREEKTHSYGDIFDWVKLTGAMALSAHKGNRTRTIFMNEKNEPSAEIFAKSVTRATEKANAQARGRVNIVQFSKDKSEPAVRMGGEWAEMIRQERIIRLNGSPYVEGEMGRIGARDIILYYEEQRYEMLGILPGVVEKHINQHEESQ